MDALRKAANYFIDLKNFVVRTDASKDRYGNTIEAQAKGRDKKMKCDLIKGIFIGAISFLVFNYGTGSIHGGFVLSGGLEVAAGSCGGIVSILYLKDAILQRIARNKEKKENPYEESKETKYGLRDVFCGSGKRGYQPIKG